MEPVWSVHSPVVGDGGLIRLYMVDYRLPGIEKWIQCGKKCVDSQILGKCFKNLANQHEKATATTIEQAFNSGNVFYHQW